LSQTTENLTVEAAMNYKPRRDVLNQFGISVRTLGRWEKNRKFPKPIRASELVTVYDEQEIESWLKAQNTDS
jgi:predicted DNA-binding transcriptional regulator AlpA